MTDGQGMPPEASSTWERVTDEADALAADYRERGWETLVVNPGDVTVVDQDEYFGLDVLAPDSTYDRVRSLVEANTFDRSHVYRQDGTALTYFVCVFEGDKVALVVPAYVGTADLDRLYARAREADEMQLHVRPLEYVERSTLRVSDPSTFFSGEI